MTAVRVVHIVGQNRNKVQIGQIGKRRHGRLGRAAVRVGGNRRNPPHRNAVGVHPALAAGQDHVPDRGVRLRRQRGQDGVPGRERCEFPFPQSRFAGARVYGACGKVGIQHRAHAAGAHADLRHDADQPRLTHHRHSHGDAGGAAAVERQLDGVGLPPAAARPLCRGHGAGHQRPVLPLLLHGEVAVQPAVLVFQNFRVQKSRAERLILGAQGVVFRLQVADIA